MFQSEQRSSLLQGAATILVLIFHNSVRSIRKTHRNAVISILYNILQTLVMVGAFFILLDLLGLRGLAIRGDFLLYVMSGIFVFMTHVKSVGAVMGSEGPTSPMMQHRPMNQVIAVCASALGALYTQVVSMFAILLVYHLVWTPIEIYNPFGAAMMLLLAWFSGCSVGMVLLALKPWFPKLTAIFMQIYSRANMFASGKMFVANTLPAHMIVMFDWNPLFHIIDQGRGYIFVNYNPMKSSLMYPFWVSLVLLAIGIIGVFYTSRQASLSWDAAR
ncbi:MAG: ABC transporter permease [Boseongicola sp.]|nr:ABC transporter permease [Boseongicola sp.]NNL19639.1 ABC transporter permease [Boseongicola sp.]